MRGFIAEKPKVAAMLSFTRVVAAWDMGLERVCRGAPHVIVAHADKNWGFGAEDTALALSYSSSTPRCSTGYLLGRVLLLSRQRPPAALRGPEAAGQTQGLRGHDGRLPQIPVPAPGAAQAAEGELALAESSNPY